MKVNIFGVKYKVSRVAGMDELDGEIDYAKKTISIATNQRGEEYYQTLIHEMIHGFWRRISLHQTEIDENLQEVICDAVATMLVENFHLRLKLKK